MGMNTTLSEFLGVEEAVAPSADVVAAKMALDFEADVFLRMKELGLKQKDLAELLGVSPAAVSKLLSGESNMRLSSIAKVAVALKCDVVSPKLVALDSASNVNSSATISSGVSITITVDKAPQMKKKLSADSHDEIDEEYRELCAKAKDSEVSKSIGNTDEVPKIPIEMIGVAA